MHGTIMVFLGIVPLPVGAFGNYVMPLQIGAPDMAFPKLNMMSYWVFFVGGVVMLASFFAPGGRRQLRLDLLSAALRHRHARPDYVADRHGLPDHVVAAWARSTSSSRSSSFERKGLTSCRLPFFVWTQFVTSFLLLLAFPPLEAAGVLQLMDRLAGTSFFMPDGLSWSGRRGSRSGRRRQPGALAAPVLVLGSSRGVRFDPAGDGHRRRSDRQQYPQAALGLRAFGATR